MPFPMPSPVPYAVPYACLASPRESGSMAPALRSRGPTALASRSRLAVRGGRSAARLGPDAALVHQGDLLLDDLLAVLGVLHRGALEVEVLGVDRLLVQDLVQLGA